jgi:hypothetical protein
MPAFRDAVLKPLYAQLSQKQLFLLGNGQLTKMQVRLPHRMACASACCAPLSRQIWRRLPFPEDYHVLYLARAHKFAKTQATTQA